MVGGFNSNSNIDNPQPKTLSPETPKAQPKASPTQFKTQTRLRVDKDKPKG